MPVDLEPQDWIKTVSAILTIVSVIITLFPIILKYKEKLSKTIFYKKIESKASIYYLWGSKRKFLIFGVIFLITGVSIFSISMYQIRYPSPTVQSETVSPKDFIEEGRGGIFSISESGDLFLTIDKAQNLLWKRGWNENKRLKRIKIDYTTSGTQIMIGLGSNLTSYSLNKTSATSTLEIENFSIPYEQNKAYYMGIINVGENSFNLFNIKIEEEVSKPQDSAIIMVLISYILVVFSFYSFKKHKTIWKQEKIPPPDLLNKEAKYADRVKNIEFELELHQNMLKNLEDLNLKGDISTNFYQNKKNHFEENIHKLINEKNTIASEIEGILRKFNKD